MINYWLSRVSFATAPFVACVPWNPMVNVCSSVEPFEGAAASIPALTFAAPDVANTKVALVYSVEPTVASVRGVADESP